jgi:hypothetical protein
MWEQLELEKYELFDPIAQEYSRLLPASILIEIETTKSTQYKIPSAKTQRQTKSESQNTGAWGNKKTNSSWDLCMHRTQGEKNYAGKNVSGELRARTWEPSRKKDKKEWLLLQEQRMGLVLRSDTQDRKTDQHCNEHGWCDQGCAANRAAKRNWNHDTDFTAVLVRGQKSSDATPSKVSQQARTANDTFRLRQINTDKIELLHTHNENKSREQKDFRSGKRRTEPGRMVTLWNTNPTRCCC